MTTPKSGSPQLMRHLNTSLVLATVRGAGSLSRADICRATGLSKPTVNQVVELLLRAGYVTESVGDGVSGRPGRRARLVAFRADMGHVLGVDIGANKVLVLAADLNGAVVATERRRVGGAEDAESVLREVRRAVRSVLASARLRRDRLKAVGVGTPGVVDPVTGSVSLAPQLPGWEGIKLAGRLRSAFPCPVLVDNEVHLSVLAERWRGAAQGVDDAVYLQLGVGIGAGILIRGELYRGAAGAAGEIGYLPLPNGDHPIDGLGAFEHAAGGSAFARLGRAAARRSEGEVLRRLAGGDPDAVDAEIVFAAAADGDPTAAEIVDELVGRIARGIASVVAVLNPATVIVGGGMSGAGLALVERLDRLVAGLVPVPPRLVLSSLGDEAVALGAVRLAIQSVDERLFSFEEQAV